MADMEFPTSFLFIAAACILPVLRGGGLRAAVLLAVPAVCRMAGHGRSIRSAPGV